VLFAIGDSFSGLSARVAEGRLQVLYRASPTQTNDAGVLLQPGPQVLELLHTATGNRQGRAQVVVAGAAVGELDTTPTFLRIGGEGMDVGRDRKRKVIPGLANGDSHAYPGHIRFVRIEPGPQAPGSIVNRLESLAQLD
jgi:arylsulfatase